MSGTINIPRQRPTFVYAIQMSCSIGFIKIGISNDVKRRLASMQTSNPYSLKVIRQWGPFDSIYAKRLEQRLHLAFEEVCSRGEWFGVDVEDISMHVLRLSGMGEKEFRAWLNARRFEGAA